MGAQHRIEAVMSIKFSVGVSDQEHERERAMLERSRRSAPRPVRGSEDPGARRVGWPLLTTAGSDDEPERERPSWAW